MSERLSRRAAVFVMICTASLWSIAGVLTRQLEAARGFEVTFWRSVFAAGFVIAALLWQHKKRALEQAVSIGRWGILSSFMWSIMFCCFMIALTMTTVANTLVVMGISPLLTALLAAFFLQQQIAGGTWLAIAAASLGMAGMFAGTIQADAAHLGGMLVALAVPVAYAINFLALKKAG